MLFTWQTFEFGSPGRQMWLAQPPNVARLAAKCHQTNVFKMIVHMVTEALQPDMGLCKLAKKWVCWLEAEERVESSVALQACIHSR